VADLGEIGLTDPDRGRGLSIPPRLETPIGFTGVPSSFGDEVVDLARQILGIELMPWQVHCLRGQLAHDGTGNLLHKRSLVSVARQNGKSVALKALALWWLVKQPIHRGEKQLVISTAHKLDLAVALFQDLAPILEAQFGAKIKWSYGRNECELADGTKWLIQASSGAAFHGRSPDLILADEIWDISLDVIFNGAIPSQRARKNSLFSAWSTAGTESSAAFLKLREEGLKIIDEHQPGRLYMAEWSPPAGVDPSDEAFWHFANPALGHTLDMDTIRDESRSPDQMSFMRASLNVWVSSAQSWLQPGTFDRGKIDQIPEGGVLAVDSSIDESQYVGVRAQLLDGGQIGVEIAFIASSLPEMWAKVSSISQSVETVALTPSLEALAPLDLERKKTIVGYAELITHTATVRSFITEGRLVHTGQTVLAEHVNRAVGVKTPQGYVVSSQRSPGPITACRCMIWAAALIAKPKHRAKAAIAFGR
jgi:phage terminase large subunit-like protein